MKAILVEHRNEYGEWAWCRVLTNCTSTQALVAYYEDKGEDMPDIVTATDGLYCDDEVRAYEITIETL